MPIMKNSGRTAQNWAKKMNYEQQCRLVNDGMMENPDKNWFKQSLNNAEFPDMTQEMNRKITVFFMSEQNTWDHVSQTLCSSWVSYRRLNKTMPSQGLKMGTSQPLCNLPECLITLMVKKCFWVSKNNFMFQFCPCGYVLFLVLLIWTT